MKKQELKDQIDDLRDALVEENKRASYAENRTFTVLMALEKRVAKLERERAAWDGERG